VPPCDTRCAIAVPRRTVRHPTHRAGRLHATCRRCRQEERAMDHHPEPGLPKALKAERLLALAFVLVLLCALPALLLG